MDKSGFPVMMSQCFWCNKEKNEILIGQRLVKNVDQTPRMVMRDYEPCDACKSNFAAGIHMIEASETPYFKGQPSINKNPPAYPSGTFAVVRSEALERIFSDPKKIADIEAKGACLLDSESFNILFPKALLEKQENDEEVQS